MKHKAIVTNEFKLSLDDVFTACERFCREREDVYSGDASYEVSIDPKTNALAGIKVIITEVKEDAAYGS